MGGRGSSTGFAGRIESPQEVRSRTISSEPKMVTAAINRISDALSEVKSFIDTTVLKTGEATGAIYSRAGRGFNGMNGVLTRLEEIHKALKDVSYLGATNQDDNGKLQVMREKVADWYRAIEKLSDNASPSVRGRLVTKISNGLRTMSRQWKGG